jgi:hypothetical protein
VSLAGVGSFRRALWAFQQGQCSPSRATQLSLDHRGGVQSQFKPYTLADVLRVVADNDKQRFALQEAPWGDAAVFAAELLIRANQGHTVQVEQLQLELIASPEDLVRRLNE